MAKKAANKKRPKPLQQRTGDEVFKAGEWIQLRVPPHLRAPSPMLVVTVTTEVCSGGCEQICYHCRVNHHGYESFSTSLAKFFDIEVEAYEAQDANKEAAIARLKREALELRRHVTELQEQLNDQVEE